MQTKLQFKRLDPRAKLPTRATEGSAGMDLYALLEAPVTIAPGETVTVPTGIAMSLESPAYVGLVFPRSGLSIKHGIDLANSVGVIDSDYRGELRVGLRNESSQAYTIEPDERIAQLAILPVVIPTVEEVTELGDTQRGTGGFGSTGTH